MFNNQPSTDSCFGRTQLSQLLKVLVESLNETAQNYILILHLQ